MISPVIWPFWPWTLILTAVRNSPIYCRENMCGDSGDHDLPRLFNFYKSYRAYVRAKIHSFTSEGSGLSVKEKKTEIQSAKKYYQLADRYIQRDRTPRLIVVFGLMGSGKTSLARALAAETGWPVISSDEIRKTIQGISTYGPTLGTISEREFTRRRCRKRPIGR